MIGICVLVIPYHCHIIATYITRCVRRDPARAWVGMWGSVNGNGAILGWGDAVWPTGKTEVARLWCAALGTCGILYSVMRSSGPCA